MSNFNRQENNSENGFSADEREAYFGWQEIEDNRPDAPDEEYEIFDCVDDIMDYPDDDGMDGDHESGLRDAGYGTDEDYGYYEDYSP